MTGTLAQICRHPIKGHGRETLASVRLLAGACLPWDRRWAVAHDAAQLQSGWNPCVNFARGAKAPALMAITSTLDEATGRVTLHHPDQDSLEFDPENAADAARFITWVKPLNPSNRAQPVSVVSAGRGMTDSEFPSISVLSTASLAALSAKMGVELSRDRWRGNLWLDGGEAWAEFGWIGRNLRVGGAVLRIEERITRCKATTVNPMTGHVDADTLGALAAAYGHQDFGVYAIVIKSGPIAVGDEWSLA